MTITRPLGVPVATPPTYRQPLTRARLAELTAEDQRAVQEAQAAYDAALEAATDAAQERHHVDRNSAWWMAKGTTAVKLAASHLDRAIAGAWVRAFWRNLSVED